MFPRPEPASSRERGCEVIRSTGRSTPADVVQGRHELRSHRLADPGDLVVVHGAGHGLDEHDQVEVAAVEGEALAGSGAEVRAASHVLIAGQEGGVLLDVTEEGEGDEVPQGVAPEHALAVDEATDPGCTVRAVHEDVAPPQVEVDQAGGGDLVQGVVRRLRGAGHLFHGPGQPGPITAGVVQDGVVHGGEGGAPVGGERAEGPGRVAEPGAGDLVEPGHEAAQLRT